MWLIKEKIKCSWAYHLHMIMFVVCSSNWFWCRFLCWQCEGDSLNKTQFYTSYKRENLVSLEPIVFSKTQSGWNLDVSIQYSPYCVHTCVFDQHTYLYECCESVHFRNKMVSNYHCSYCTILLFHYASSLDKLTYEAASDLFTETSWFIHTTLSV